MEDIEIQVWPDKVARWEELREPWFYFCKCEPLNAAIEHVLDEGDNKESLAAMLKDMMSFDDSPLIVAWDKVKNQAAGFLFAAYAFADKSKDETHDTLYGFRKYKFDPDTLEKLEVMVKFLEDMFKQADVFKRYGVDKVTSIQVTSVRAEYTRRGIANKLTSKFLEVAKEKELQVVTAESTSAYTQHNKMSKFGFEKILELDYATHYPTYSQMPENIREAHKAAAVLAKRL